MQGAQLYHLIVVTKIDWYDVQILAHVSPSPKQAIKQGDTNTEHQSSDLEEALVDLNVARKIILLACLMNALR